jgi:hypothetical protein
MIKLNSVELLCYCFDISKEEVLSELSEKGSTGVFVKQKTQKAFAVSQI